MPDVNHVFMQRALELARQGPISDNPRVGAVIVRNHHIVGEGFHRGAGTPHAEIEAIAQAGELARGAQIYVSLEPCKHHGRTGPCTDAIIEAGIRSVVFAQSDPTVQAGGGAQVLDRAGITVSSGLLAGEAERLNRPWSHWAKTGKPYVTWKFAQSIDARVADRLSARTEISGSEARVANHVLRSEVDAIIVGTRTVAIDNPQLTSRNPDSHNQPLRVVVGESDIPAKAALTHTMGGEVLHLRTHDISQVLNDLTERGVRHILLEGGPTLAGAFLDVGAVHQILTIIAPVTFGAGPQALSTLLDPHFTVTDIHWERLGPDLMISGTLVRQ